jgi:hypothetical protein
MSYLVFSESILEGIKLCQELKELKSLDNNLNTALRYTNDAIEHHNNKLKLNKESIENYLKIQSKDPNPNSKNIQDTFKKLYETRTHIKEKKRSLEIAHREIDEQRKDNNCKEPKITEQILNLEDDKAKILFSNIIFQETLFDNCDEFLEFLRKNCQAITPIIEHTIKHGFIKAIGDFIDDINKDLYNGHNVIFNNALQEKLVIKISGYKNTLIKNKIENVLDNIMRRKESSSRTGHSSQPLASRFDIPPLIYVFLSSILNKKKSIFDIEFLNSLREKDDKGKDFLDYALSTEDNIEKEFINKINQLTSVKEKREIIFNKKLIADLNIFKSFRQNFNIGNYQLTKKSIHIRSTKNTDGTNKRRLSNQQLIQTYEFTDKNRITHEIGVIDNGLLHQTNRGENKNKSWQRLGIIDLGAKTRNKILKSRIGKDNKQTKTTINCHGTGANVCLDVATNPEPGDRNAHKIHNGFYTSYLGKASKGYNIDNQDICELEKDGTQASYMDAMNQEDKGFAVAQRYSTKFNAEAIVIFKKHHDNGTNLKQTPEYVRAEEFGKLQKTLFNICSIQPGVNTQPEAIEVLLPISLS